MWPYWLLFLVPAIAALVTTDRGPSPRLGNTAYGWTPGWVLAGIALALMIGYRFEVGGDWFNYFRFLDIVAKLPLPEVLSLPDPGYMLLNWLASTMGGSLIDVNLICGVIFSTGLVLFCRSLPRPWLALATAIPYLVIVVGMGYSRQGVALSLSMLGLLALLRQSTLRFLIWVILGATFHKTAVLLLPIAALASTKNRYWTAVWVAVVTAGAYFLLLADAVDHLYSSYIEGEYQSEGAMIRLLMNALPAAVLLIWRRRFNFSTGAASLWLWFSLISLVLLGVLLVSSASTAVDRIALYMLPLQLVVFSHLPELLGSHSYRARGHLVLLVLLYYSAVLFVWLFFAKHSKYWLPYKFFPLMSLQ